MFHTKDVIIGATFATGDSVISNGNGGSAFAVIDFNRIASGTAINAVVTSPETNEIVAHAAEQGIFATVPLDQVIACTSVDIVSATPSAE